MTITGVVEHTGDIVVVLRVRGTSITIETRATIDTGFNGALSLDSEDIRALGLRPRAEIRYRLADGSLAESRLFDAEIQWLGTWKRVPVVETRGGSLVGMQSLFGHRLVVEVVPGGSVEIAAL